MIGMYCYGNYDNNQPNSTSAQENRRSRSQGAKYDTIEMKISTCNLAVSLFLVLCAVDVAAEPSKRYLSCQRAFQKIADAHISKASKVEAAHLSKLDGMLDRFYSRVGPGVADQLGIRDAADRIANRIDLDVYRQRYGSDIADKIMGYLRPDGPKYKCASRVVTISVSRNQLQYYKAALGQIREEVQSRLEVESLSDDEGLAVIAFHVFGRADDVRINRLGSLGGNIVFGPIVNGQYFRIQKVPAGRYGWDQIKNSTFFGNYRYKYGKDELEFMVLAGKLNIVGYFTFDQRGQYAAATLDDRSGLVIRLLKERYPDLVDRFEIVNGLVPDDKFIDYYMSQRKEQGQASLDAN